MDNETRSIVLSILECINSVWRWWNSTRLNACAMTEIRPFLLLLFGPENEANSYHGVIIHVYCE